MSFDYCIAYEDRSCLRTSRWALSGVDTRSPGNTKDGWLWLNCVKTGQTVTAALYKDPAGAPQDKVAEGTVNVAGIDAAPALCTFSPANQSGLGGTMYLESYLADDAAVPVLVSLCTDSDLADEYHHLADLPATVYSATAGMARYCAAATRKVLLLASQMYAAAMGGFGAPEHRYSASASRAVPDYRRLAAPDQLKEAAVHWALTLAFGSCHERASHTMFSKLRDYHDTCRREAVSAWNLTFNTNPDLDQNADALKAPGMVRVTRL
ncbi:MAG: hypothetical protein ABFD92_09210 [Planctomycetaceae bacterium]|nr:hypothetical protein [Planctomycetaceae bacterium]